MKKPELLKSIAEVTEVTQKDVEKVLGAFVDVVKAEVLEGGKIELRGFGTFTLKENNARKGRNLQTDEEIDIPASIGLKFKQSSVIKKEFNK